MRSKKRYGITNRKIVYQFKGDTGLDLRIVEYDFKDDDGNVSHCADVEQCKHLDALGQPVWEELVCVDRLTEKSPLSV